VVVQERKWGKILKDVYKSVNVCIEDTRIMYRRIEGEHSSLSNNYAKPAMPKNSIWCRYVAVQERIWGKILKVIYKSVNVCIEDTRTVYRRIKEGHSSLSNNYAKPVRALCQITSDCPDNVVNCVILLCKSYNIGLLLYKIYQTKPGR
jgi:ribosomal protein L24